MIREIYVVVEYGEVKAVCEAKQDAEKLAAICGERAWAEKKPFFPAYGYMKLRGDGDE